jgi:hypothetical protein
MRLNRFRHGTYSLTRGSYRFPNERSCPAPARSCPLFISVALNGPLLATPADAADAFSNIAAVDGRMIVTPTPIACGSTLEACSTLRA